MNDEIPIEKIELKTHFRHQLESPSDYISRMINGVIAKVVDTHDQAIVDAVLEEAKRLGFTTLYLIDKDFVIRAFTNEINRMKENSDAEN